MRRVKLAGVHAPAVLYDPLFEPDFCQELLRLFDAQSGLPARHGRLAAWQTPAYAHLRGDRHRGLAARPVGAEQSNSSLVYGDRLILKLFGRVEMGLSPDLEINEHLAQRGFSHVPPLAGALEYRRPGEEPWTLGMMQGFVPNQGDAWHDVLRRLARALEGRDWRGADAAPAAPSERGGMAATAEKAIPPGAVSAFGDFLAYSDRLGTRTAQLHLALTATDEPQFAAEPFSVDDRRQFAERTIGLIRETFALLRDHATALWSRNRPDG